MKENKLDEVLITGGDPFLSPKKLSKFIYKILDEFDNDFFEDEDDEPAAESKDASADKTED